MLSAVYNIIKKHIMDSSEDGLPQDPGRRKILCSIAMGSVALATGCSKLIPSAKHSDPRVQASFELAEMILKIGDSSGLYGIELKSGTPVLLQPLTPDTPILVPQNEIPHELLALILATEDPSYFLHPGVDLNKLISGGFNYLTKREAQDTSTLTQQIARNLPGSVPNELWIKEKQSNAPEKKNLERQRKFEEIKLAKALEERFTKKELALLYCNLPYLGVRNDSLTPISIHGLLMAASAYFGKSDLKSLTPAQMAHIVGMLHNPSIEAPKTGENKGKLRRIEVLQKAQEFKLLLTFQLNEGLPLDKDRDFAQQILNHLESLDLDSAKADDLTPRTLAEAPIAAPTIGNVIRGLEEPGNPNANQSPKLSLFTRVETTIITEFQKILVENLLDLPKKYKGAPVSGIIANRGGDLVAMAAINSREMNPFNSTINCSGLLWPLRVLIEISKDGNAEQVIARAAKRRQRKPGLDAALASDDLDGLAGEIALLQKEPAIWNKLIVVLGTLINSDLKSRNIKTPGDLKKITLSPAELVKLYLTIIRDTSDVPKYLRLAKKIQDVYSGQASFDDSAEMPLLDTTLLAGRGIQMLEILRQMYGPGEAQQSSSAPGDTYPQTNLPLVLAPLNHQERVRIALTPDHICLITLNGRGITPNSVQTALDNCASQILAQVAAAA